MRTSHIVKKSVGTNEKIKLSFSICAKYLRLKVSLSLLKWLLIFILAFIVISVVGSNWQFAFNSTATNDYFYNNDLDNGFSSASFDISEDNMEIIWIAIIAIYIFIVVPSVLFYNLYYLRISNEFVFSDRRVLVKTGWIATKIISINHNRITDVSITQNLIDRLLGIGTLAISTAGSEGYHVSLTHISNPHKKKKVLHELREEYRKSYRLIDHDENEDGI